MDAGLPKGYVLASLLVSPENAAGGRISAGDYVDIAAVSGSDASAHGKIVLHHVLVMDVTVSPDTVANNAASSSTGASSSSGVPGPNSPALYGGIPQLYSFAVSPEEFVKLALIRNSSVYLALTSATATGSIDVTLGGGDVFSPGSVDSSSSTGSSTPTASSVKTSVEAFYTKHKAAGDVMKVNGSGSTLIAYNKTNTPVEQIDLAGGTIDLTTGTYTAAAN